MASVTGYTAAHMDEIADTCIISGAVVLDNLILTTRGGDEIDAGPVIGPPGEAGTDALLNTLFPIGSETTWPGTLASIPPNWMHEDGRLLLRADYPDLYDALLTSWNTGGEDSDHFRIPNSINKFIIGAGGSYSVGTYGGSNTHTLSQPEMPVHNHTITDPGHSHNIPDQPLPLAGGPYTFYVLGGSDTFAGGAVNHTTGITINNKGGTAGVTKPHKNMPAVGAKYVIIRAS